MFGLCVHIALVVQLLREQWQQTGWRWGRRRGRNRGDGDGGDGNRDGDESWRWHCDGVSVKCEGWCWASTLSEGCVGKRTTIGRYGSVSWWCNGTLSVLLCVAVLRWYYCVLLWFNTISRQAKMVVVIGQMTPLDGITIQQYAVLRVIQRLLWQSRSYRNSNTNSNVQPSAQIRTLTAAFAFSRSTILVGGMIGE